MITMHPDSNLLPPRQLNNLIAYLILTGWKIERESKRWFEFSGASNTQGQPIALILPRDPEASDLENYISKAVKIINAISDESIEITKQRISHYNSDVLTVENLETGDYDSITLKLAGTQMGVIQMS